MFLPSWHYDNLFLRPLLLIHLQRWDEIEIQEQTDDKVFTSVIRVPLKPNIALNNIFSKLNHNLSFVLPHTLPKAVHVQFIEQNISVVMNQYHELAGTKLNQKQALQFLFDVKYLTMFFVPRENVLLKNTSHDICDKLRSQIDPFDLDVFYSYLQSNVKRAVVQSQVSTYMEQNLLHNNFLNQFTFSIVNIENWNRFIAAEIPDYFGMPSAFIRPSC